MSCTSAILLFSRDQLSTFISRVYEVKFRFSILAKRFVLVFYYVNLQVVHNQVVGRVSANLTLRQE